MKRIISTIYAIIVIFVPLCKPIILALHSDTSRARGIIGTGTVEAVVERVRLTDNIIVWSDEDGTLNNGILRVNSSIVFGFDVRNAGEGDIEYDLEFQIAWDGDLGESGKLLLYPDWVSDEQIFDDTWYGEYDDALIGDDLSDSTEVLLSTGPAHGMVLTLNGGLLRGEETVSYDFKLYFMGDGDVTVAPADFHYQTAEVVIAVHSGLYGNPDSWTAYDSRFFRVTSAIDVLFPMIQEIPQPKTYFITQTGDIDLTLFASADDLLDGDISHKISITSKPAFDPGRAGVYTISYTVVNSLGYAAVPLHINIIVWDFVKLVSGYYHTLALTSHGKVYAWGYNVYGQVGDGTTSDRPKPVLISDLDEIIDIAAGQGSSYALAASGQAYAWGRNENGRLGDGTTTARSKPVKVHQPDGVRFVKIASGFRNAGAVAENGDVYTWGYAAYGAAGSGDSVENRVPTRINLTNIINISMGHYNGIAVDAEGTVYTWGDNFHGQLGNGASGVGTNAPAPVAYFLDSKIRIAQASAGWYHMTAVDDSGRLFTWGYGAEGRLGNGSTSDQSLPQEISLGESAKNAAAGYYHTAVMTEGGGIYFFGQNVYGKLGLGDTTNRSTPAKRAHNNVTGFALAYDSSFVLVAGREVFGSGYGGTGVLGTGNNNNSAGPAKWAFEPPLPKISNAFQIVT